MGLEIPPLLINVSLESSPAKSIILVLVWRLAVQLMTADENQGSRPAGRGMGRAHQGQV